MDLLNAVALTKPLGFWDSIIFWFEGAVGNYALALIIVTILIKLVMVADLMILTVWAGIGIKSLPQRG